MQRHTEVIENLTNAETGKKALKDLIFPVFKNPDINSIHVLGQPASGKTTVIGQFMDILNSISKKMGRGINFNPTFFDKIQSESELSIKLMDSLKEDSRFWDKKDWLSFEEKLTNAILNPMIIKKNRPGNIVKRKFTIIETPYLLYWEKENNGQKIIKNISSKSPNTFYVYVVSDLITTLKTIEMRSAIVGKNISNSLKSIPPKNLVRIMRNRFNIILVGFRNSEESGEKIIQIISRMAPEEAILRIREKTEEKINSWISSYQKSKDFTSQILLPKPYLHLPDNIQEQYINEAAYMLYILRKELKLPKEKSLVVFNTDIPNKKIYLHLKLLKTN